MAENRVAALPDGLYAQIDTTKGPILVNLYFEETPLTVMNFVGLAEGKMETEAKTGPFYDGLAFHRVIENFMIQGGDPQGNGTGGPGYRFPDEIVDNLTFAGPGALAMANSGPGTNGSQFFITHVATPWLNGKHTIFGKVAGPEDQKVVNAVAQGDKIVKVTIIRKGSKAEAFQADRGAFDSMMESIKAGAQAGFEASNAAMITKAVATLGEGYKKSPMGAYYKITQAGKGAKPTKGEKYAFHYKGSLLDSGKVFDSSYDRNEPIEFPVGVGYVIPGWDEAVMELSVGAKMLLVLPPEIAYGEVGAGGVIPPNAWLMFELERVR